MTEPDFSNRTKSFVALRASHRCSFSDCNHPTVGPSDESAVAYTNIGEAAHICAARPGGKRYDANMSEGERAHIDNAIWLCANHARLIDRDSGTYTVERLRRMKREHETACAQALRGSSTESTAAYDLIAIGPDIVCTGEVQSIKGSEWFLYLRNFVIGSSHNLIGFSESFEQAPIGDRYILVNAIGDGRILVNAPTLTSSGDGYIVQCEVSPSFPRTKAQELGSQFALSADNHDLFVENGQIARVSGLASLPQKVQSCLSMQRGEHFYYRDFGVRFAEYVDAFRDSPWLGRLLQLEVIRQSAIPYQDDVTKKTYTPLQCVERVESVVVLGEVTNKNQLPLRLDFEVSGVGRWQCEVSVFLPSTLAGAPEKRLN